MDDPLTLLQQRLDEMSARMFNAVGWILEHAEPVSVTDATNAGAGGASPTTPALPVSITELPADQQLEAIQRRERVQQLTSELAVNLMDSSRQVEALLQRLPVSRTLEEEQAEVQSLLSQQERQQRELEAAIASAERLRQRIRSILCEMGSDHLEELRRRGREMEQDEDAHRGEDDDNDVIM